MDLNLQEYVVRIATPYSIGVGFLLPSFDFIVTNAQVVKDNREVIIDNQYLKSQLVAVRYIDSVSGVAFLEIPKAFESVELPKRSVNELAIGEKVISIRLYESNYISSSEGQILQEAYEENGIPFVVHDCPISYDCIGGPLLDEHFQVLGLNMHLTNDLSAKTKVFTFPIDEIEKIIQTFQRVGPVGLRCESCFQLVGGSKDQPKPSKCPYCNNNIEFPCSAVAYEPIGVASTIEQIIEKSGRDVRLARRGPNAWEIEQGSAKVDISYYDKEGLIMGDAYLCELPETSPNKILQYLLQQNYEVDGLSFSIKGRDIVLSLLIYDGHLNVDTGFGLFQNLLTEADHYDNILVEEYGASWKS